MSLILVKEMEDQTVKKIKAVMSMTKVKETGLMLEIILKRRMNLTMRVIQTKETMEMATVTVTVTVTEIMVMETMMTV